MLKNSVFLKLILINLKGWYYESNIWKDEHKGDKKTFKSLINKFYLNIIPNTIIKANINDENDKSKSNYFLI